MDITSFVLGNRDKAFLVGDYNSYRSQLTRQLLALRKKLGRVTAKNAKFSKKEPVTAEDISQNNAFVRLLLIEAERAWAQAMHMKSTHAEDNTSTGLIGSTRSHIISRLHKARSIAENLARVLQDQGATGASDSDYLEAQAYAQSLAGAEEFEKQSGTKKEDPKAAWKNCLDSFSQAHIIYSALLYSTQKDIYKEVLAGTVDPSIRYAAYQSRLPRTIAVADVAKQHFPRDSTTLLSLIQKLNPTALEDTSTTTSSSARDGTSSEAASVPTSITWRGRTAPISDASIGQALLATSLAATHLSTVLKTLTSKSSNAQTTKTISAAYDPVLTAAADTVDAVRRALSDALKEGSAESDPRIQDLRVADLAANHALVSWRIGRNRVLISSPGTLDDGLDFTPDIAHSRRFRKKRRGKAVRGNEFHDAIDEHDEDTTMKGTTSALHSSPRTESKPHRLARLIARVVLYDATLQSIDSIKELRGASRDTGFIAELDAQRAYFQSLRCLNIAYAHQVLENHKEALALFAHAAEISQFAQSVQAPPPTTTATTTPDVMTLTITPTQLTALQSHSQLALTRQHGLVALHAARATELASAKAAAPFLPPLGERLHRYPAAGYVDFTRLVDFPPKFQPVPVKPIFLDIAWNYIDYPGREGMASAKNAGVGMGVVGKAAETVETVAGAAPAVVQNVVEAAKQVVGKAGGAAAGVIGGEREARRREEEEQGAKKGRWGGWFGRG